MATSSQSMNGDPLSDLTGFQRDLLYAISKLGSPHGLAIKDHLEKYYNGGEINHGRLYPNLDILVEKSLVNKGELDRRTNFYEITSRGQTELDSDLAWRSDCN